MCKAPFSRHLVFIPIHLCVKKNDEICRKLEELETIDWKDTNSATLSWFLYTNPSSLAKINIYFDAPRKLAIDFTIENLWWSSFLIYLRNLANVINRIYKISIVKNDTRASRTRKNRESGISVWERKTREGMPWRRRRRRGRRNGEGNERSC